MRTPTSGRLAGQFPITLGQTGTGPAGQLTANIDGEFWLASAAIQAALHDGILAIAGFDAWGRGIALALLTEPLNVPQLIGPSPANAMLTFQSSIWLATDSRGSGSLTLLSLGGNRASGIFSFAGVALSPRHGPESRTVTQGKFDLKW
jgi:hypothetical protein